MAAVSFDPDDLTRVGKALEASLVDELGAVTMTDGPARVGHGLDTYIYRFQLAGDGLGGGWEQPLILRIFAAPHQEEKARRETAVQEFLSRAGFPAPRPLIVEGADNDLGLPFMIMERVPGSPMLDRFKNPLAIPGLLRQMVDLHVRLHRLPLDGSPLPYEGPLVDRRLAEVRELVERFGLSELAEPLAWIEEHRDVVAAEEPAMLHNDFHPLNVMLSDEGETHVLDWSDAAVGDRHHDLARTLALFWLAPPLARSILERLLLTAARGYLISRYLARYAEQLPVDRDRLRYWEALHAAMAWAQVAAIRGGRGEELGAKPEAVEQIPPGFVRSLQAYFWNRTQPS
jgi:aminoglycoside phosphotransferase (APT) family kinase protein